MHLREKNPELIELALSLSQLKKIYVALFSQMHQRGVAAALDDIDEDDMLLTLQTYLQRRATAAGVDGTIHADWERFLGITDAPSCEVRMANRRPTE